MMGCRAASFSFCCPFGFAAYRYLQVACIAARRTELVTWFSLVWDFGFGVT